MRVVNDASLQALVSYRGGQMLFLGIGTGLGSALAWDNILMPLELGDLPYRHGHIIENYLGIPGLALLGEKKWKREVAYAVTQLRKSFVADYVLTAVSCTVSVACRKERNAGKMRTHSSVVSVCGKLRNIHAN